MTEKTGAVTDTPSLVVDTLQIVAVEVLSDQVTIAMGTVSET